MGGIRPIGNVPEPTEPRKPPPRERDRTEEVTGQDELEISPEARRAVEVARLVEVARDLPDVREDRVDEARDEIEAGRYRDYDATRETARRLLGG